MAIERIAGGNHGQENSHPIFPHALDVAFLRAVPSLHFVPGQLQCTLFQTAFEDHLETLIETECCALWTDR